MIEIDIQKSFKNKNEQINFHFKTTIENNSINAIFGQSGSGKTTFLRLLSGLETPDIGYIKVNDKIWFDSKKKINLVPQKRDVGFVFQDYALFPNMSVIKNLRFAQQEKNENFLQELLEIVDLKELQNKFPNALSGGEKQRVALIRAVARRPKLFLLDEAFSALDYSMRQQLQDSIDKIHKSFKMTTLFISHDISEVYRLSSHIKIVKNGKIVKEGTPDILFDNSKISGKFKFSAKILKIKKADIVYIITLLIGNNLTKVVATKEEVNKLNTGDTILVATKAFNPIIII
ncbi:MAG: ATP-binding cassette domain-containing protein [Sulfurospirillum sp.]|nr:ATP-binding cassette domain-containing protein [Sulfurospirillum sp.]